MPKVETELCIGCAHSTIEKEALRKKITHFPRWTYCPRCGKAYYIPGLPPKEGIVDDNDKK